MNSQISNHAACELEANGFVVAIWRAIETQVVILEVSFSDLSKVRIPSIVLLVIHGSLIYHDVDGSVEVILRPHGSVVTSHSRRVVRI